MEFRCPICRQEVRSEGNAYRPFCSERCKLIDLESWVSGRYRVPVEEDSPDSPDSIADQETSPANGNS